MSTPTHVYLVIASVAYEGSSVAGVYASQASADAYVAKHTKALERFEAAIEKNPDDLRPFPKHFGESLHTERVKVLP